MRALAAIALLLVSGADVPRHRRFLQRSLPKARTATTASAYSFCAQFSAGNKSGAWSCFNGDITSPAASTLTFVGVNSPAVTTGTTCAAPSYATLVNGATDSHIDSASTMSTPAGDFTACILFTPTAASSTLYTYIMFGHYSDITPYGFTQESDVAYFSGGDEKSIIISGVTQNAKTLLCFRWTASTKVGGYYINLGAGGSSDVAAANAAAMTSQTSLLHFGAENASRNLDGKVFGGFLTHKILTNGDLDTFFSSTVTCP